YLRDNSGVKKRRQPLCRKGLSVICLKMVLETRKILTGGGCDHAVSATTPCKYFTGAVVNH
ncbi:hypothetical protein, partial [Klebsiella pneumoniae]|uniref:hypothetical protein n=1 Tax=Klebsiella pneumoniae TaxID=573 RepID=UPI0038550396